MKLLFGTCVPLYSNFYRILKFILYLCKGYLPIYTTKSKKFFSFGFLKPIIPILLPCLLVHTNTYANNIYDSVFLVAGEIMYANGKPASNVIVKNITSNESTKSDINGNFTINANTNNQLLIEADGFETINYTIIDTATIKLVLKAIKNIEQLAAQNKVVELIYTQAPKYVTASCTESLQVNDIVKMPVTNVKNLLTGRMAGLYAFQNTGQPGVDGASLLLRGQEPLVMIDGVVANLTLFNPEDIESVTLQKDALSTAMLGVRGSNGVLLITTKKGKIEKSSISFTAQKAFQQSVGVLQPLPAFDYATLYNEALVNDGLPIKYNQSDLDAYKNNTDPYGHPNINWRDQVTKPSSRFDQYSLYAKGGNQYARYYVSLQHINQSGFLVTSDKNKYNTNNNFKSYAIRSNIDVSITKNLTGGIYILGRILNSGEPGVGVNSIFSSIINTPNNAYPVLNSDGSYGGNIFYQNNIMAQTVSSGYRLNYKRDMITNFYLKQNLGVLIPGLWTQVKTSFNAFVSENIFRNKSFAVFQMTSATPTAYAKYGLDGTQVNTNAITFQGRTNYVELSVGYDKQVNKKHGINVLFLGNRDNMVNDANLPYTISGLSGRIAYNYKEKYFTEAAFGYNGANRYPGKNGIKRGFLPAFGLGWNMERESFLTKIKWVNRLKLYGSFGQTGWDDPGYFTYIQRFFDATPVYFGTSAGGATTITEQPFANEKISWEKANKFNVGIDALFFNSQLGFTVDYFNNKYYDLLQIRGRSISMIGNNYPRENIGQNRYSGIEFTVNWQRKNNTALQYTALANVSLLQSKTLFMDEVFTPYDWMRRTGQRVGQMYGYIAEGLFQTQAEINNSATTVGYIAQPGDIKYKDLNNDGLINQFDVAPIGRVNKPLLFFGLTLQAIYKGIDVSALIQGVTNNDTYIGDNSTWAFQNNGFGQAYGNALNRWTPNNAATATFPRLSIGANNNNQANSSYWVRKADYARLKHIELGYNISPNLLKHIKLQNVRLFAVVYNVLTLTSKQLDNRDPEVTSLYSYPLQRVINFGINIKL